MYCTNCGKVLREGSRFCGYCGYTLKNESAPQPNQKKKCSKCLNEYRTEYVFCENCGTLLKSVPMGFSNDYCSLKLAGVYYYSGTAISLMPVTTGMLSFYNDKVDFSPSNGNLQFQINSNNNTAYGSIHYDSIASVTEGNSIAIKYFTIHLKDGRALTFSKLGSYYSTIMMILKNHIEQI